MKSTWIIVVLCTIAAFGGGYAAGQAVYRSTNVTTATTLDNPTLASFNEKMATQLKQINQLKQQSEEKSAQQIQQIDFLKNTNTSLTQDRDTCQAKFQRSTILYDGTVFENRRWILPVDVDPVLVTPDHYASYSHYDPKTQVETVKLAPKTQH